MTFDVYGNNAKNEKGEHFCNSVWWWTPLWDYCQNVHGDIAGVVVYGRSNDGDGLDAAEAYALGVRLATDIETGFTAEYETKYRQRLYSLPRTDCQRCEGSGIRTDLTGVEGGMPTKELDEVDAILLGRTHGWCNACRGEGKHDPWEANYPFSVENVQEFAEFLLNCGGFRIC